MRKYPTYNCLASLLLLAALPRPLAAQTWNEVIKAVASDRGTDDLFGYSVAISGDYAIVGAPQEDQNASGGGTVMDAGSAYVFTRSGSTWTQQQKIVASDRAAHDLFGYSVAISGDYAIVGAYSEDEDASGSNTLSGAGSCYIFTRNGSTWSQQQKIVASDRAAYDRFGWSVAISGDHAIVGAYLESEDALGGNTATEAGSSYIFVRNGSTWTQQQKIVASDRAAVDYFGWSVAISGDHAIVGAHWEDEDAAGLGTATDAGSAYIFIRNGTTWTQQQKIVASDRHAGDWFGYSVAISGDYAIVGAYLETEDALGGNTILEAGSSYIFVRNGSTWTQQQKIVASDRFGLDRFGWSVAISGDDAIVGARRKQAAYMFSRNGSTWSEQQKVEASVGASTFDAFGASVAISGDQALSCAHLECYDASGSNFLNYAGSAYFFARTEAVSLAPKLWLEGPLVVGPPTLMGEALRTQGLLPNMEPYSGLGFANFGGGGGETTSTSVLNVTGNDAIVDWVRIELRSSADPTTLVATLQCLLQRDGDVVSSISPVTPITLNVPPGNYYVAIRHRNHLGCMTSAAVPLNNLPTTIDFRNSGTPTYGTDARKTINGQMALWMGNTVRDTPGPFRLKYAGANNDRDPILMAVGGNMPTNTISGYRVEDVTMDGITKYTGSLNDRDPILVNVGAIPTATRTEQLP